MRESAVEAKLREGTERLGGKCIKLVPIEKGLPDRLVLLPGGRHYLIELKKDGGKTSKAQDIWHERADRIGHPVVVLEGSEDVQRWLEEQS